MTSFSLALGFEMNSEQVDVAGLFSDVPAGSRVGVAVSGGGDSVALLLLAVEAGLAVEALTVDHGLRAAAAGEADWVGDLCARLGMRHHVLRWEHSGIESGVVAKARGARYDLMGELCFARELSHLLLGHTCDDQAETVYMRQQRSSDTRGLAGIAPVVTMGQETNGLKLVRPLLNVSRKDLRCFLRKRGQDWIDDPTNEDVAFERVRVRALLSDDASLCSELLDIQKRSAVARSSDAKAAALWLEAHVRSASPGVYEFDFSALNAEGACLLALRSLMSVVGGTSYLPDRAKVESDILRALREGHGFAVTRARCVLRVRGGSVFVRGEMRGAKAAMDDDLRRQAKAYYDDGRVLRDDILAGLKSVLSKGENSRALGAFTDFWMCYDMPIVDACKQLVKENCQLLAVCVKN